MEYCHLYGRVLWRRRKPMATVIVWLVLAGLLYLPHPSALETLYPRIDPAAGDKSFGDLQTLCLAGQAELHPIHDGTLRINHSIPIHPIEQLIIQSQEDWANKMRRQSRTLQQAAAEYRRRYRRNPPNGFDRWWAYVW
jgi:hypothetical protein